MSSEKFSIGVKPWEVSDTVSNTGADWIFDRENETSDKKTNFNVANAAWNIQRVGLADRSSLISKTMKEKGVDLSKVSLGDLKVVPFCSKSDLRISQEATPPFGNHLAVDRREIKLVYQTSGTSGKPCLLALTRKDMETWWQIGSRTYRSAGVFPEHTVLVSFGAGPFVAGHTHGSIDRNGAARIPVAPGDTERIINAAEQRIFDTLLGTPSFAGYLASTLENRGFDPRTLGIRHIITGGEPGGGIPAVRERLEQAFNCDVTEAMGLGDISPSLFGECQAKQGMHFCGQGLVWPELIDPKTMEVIEIEKGAVGELVYTALQREAMPLVRFRSGDIVEILGTDCECGRTSFRMRCISRSDDMIIVRGVNVYPSAVLGVLMEFKPDITGRGRLVVEGESVAVLPPVLIEVEIRKNAQIKNGLAELIADRIREKLIFRATVKFVAEEEFGDSNYKTKLLIRK
jgi:phenylacetate-CoA ligase